MEGKEKITIRLTEKQVNVLVDAFTFLEADGMDFDIDVITAVASIKDQMDELRHLRKTEEFAQFLDNFYREYHDNDDRLGMAGLRQLAQVIVHHPDKVIEELKKY